ncbi:MAG: hypothetical protein K8J09_05535 [Planctomycetes bacterium]|nr:hypothetical protein [Planctomycetota bacterium]
MRPLLPITASLLLGALGTAQHANSNSAASQTYFMAAIELGSSADADTPLYRLRGSLGEGVVAEPHATSETYALRGSFFGASTAPVLGQPWLTAAAPFYVRRLNDGTLTLRGTELWLGPTPTVTVGGQPAAVILRTVDHMVVALPDQPVPGFQPVTFTNSAGTSTIREGVGVLPMMERREPFNGADPNYLRVHTLVNEFVLLLLAAGPGPDIQLLDFHHVLQLDPGSVFIATSIFVTAADGMTTIPLPPFPPGLVHVQALTVTADPDDTPGSFSNALAL